MAFATFTFLFVSELCHGFKTRSTSFPWRLTALNDEGPKRNETVRLWARSGRRPEPSIGFIRSDHPSGSGDRKRTTRGRFLRDAAAPVFGQRSRIVPRANEIPLVTVHDLTMRRRRILQGEILPGSPC